MHGCRRALIPVLALVAAAVVSTAPDPVAMRRDAETFRIKISDIGRRGSAGSPTPQRARTTVTESEVNSYLALDVADDLPHGVVSPTVTLEGQGRASGQAVVDLDRVRKSLGASSMLNPLSYLRGRLPVVATGTLQSRDGVAWLQFESATVSGIPVPKMVLQQIVSYYSRSERFPSGINLDDPFTLPARIREIHVERGQAIVVQ